MAEQMVLRDEWFVQRQGAGILELRGGALELALFVGDQPLIYNAADCGGSIGRFTALLPEPAALSVIRALEFGAQNGFVSDQALSEQIAPLLALLPNGSYRLALVPTHEWSAEDWDRDWSALSQSKLARGSRHLCGWYYPWDVPSSQHHEIAKHLIPTQLDEDLNNERINFYLNEIDQGARSAIIVVGAKEHHAYFLLDGHHKLMASYCCGIRLPALLIEFQTLSHVTLSDAGEILREVDFVPASYLKWKEISSQ